MTVVHCKVGVVGLPGHLFPVTGEMGKGMRAQGRQSRFIAEFGDLD